MGESDVLLEMEILKWFDPSQYDISYDHLGGRYGFFLPIT